ncbi:UDP-N-acetylmuramoyl-L-alanine--D-glutamate ligase [Pseudomonadota bacterium]
MNKKQKIGIIGAGLEGRAVVDYLLLHGYKNLTVFDEKEFLDELIPSGVEMVGKHAMEKIFDCEILFRSPGIHTAKLDEARKKGITITSTTEYFMENCPCPVIGITGTKGKGTTSTLIKLILEADGNNVYLGGNIGASPLKFLDKLDEGSWVVLELSSFQLQDLNLSPQVAIVLMTTSEHLDYHKDTDEYIEAKTPIVRFQNEEDICIVNQDYDYAKRFLSLTRAQKFTVSRKGKVNRGAYIEDGKILYIRNEGEDPVEIGDAASIALVGPHNLENVLPAVVATRKLGAQISSIQKVIYSFRGLPHRLEFVRAIDGVKFYNDSFSTTPETSIAAANAFEGDVLLIAGGSEKHSSYTDWAASMKKNVKLKAIFLMGVTADRMSHELSRFGGESKCEIIRVDGLEDAVRQAQEMASSGDNIVLSPAAASFDMFKNYKDRGESFIKIVNGL